MHCYDIFIVSSNFISNENYLNYIDHTINNHLDLYKTSPPSPETQETKETKPKRTKQPKQQKSDTPP